MIFAYTRPRYQVSVYRTIGPLVCVSYCIALYWDYSQLILNGMKFEKLKKYNFADQPTDPYRRNRVGQGETLEINTLLKYIGD